MDWINRPLLVFQHHLFFPHHHLSSSSSGTVFMNHDDCSGGIVCSSYVSLEGFLYGKISVFYVLYQSVLLLKNLKSNLYFGLGICSGIFAIYLKYASKESRSTTTGTFFYVLCSLYILSTATVVSVLISYTIDVSNNSIGKEYADPSQYTIGSTSERFTVNVISRFDCPKHSKCLL